MKNRFIIFCFYSLFIHAGCSHHGTPSNESLDEKTSVSQTSDTLYTKAAVLNIYATQPERAMQIIDTAELLGNMTETYADFLRAMV